MATKVKVNNKKGLMTSLWYMKNKKELCDATVVVNGKSIPVHKVVLASASNYFKNLFQNFPQNIVTFQNVDKNALELLLRYCYTGKIEITLDNANEILTLARILSINVILEEALNIFEQTYSFENCLSNWKIDQMGVVEKLCGKRLCILEKKSIAPDSNIDDKSKTTDTSEAVQKSGEITADDENDCDRFVSDDTIVAIGGDSLKQTRTLEIFDKHNNRWIDIYTNFEYSSYSSVFLDDKIFFIGGKDKFDETNCNIDYYDLKKGTMHKLSRMFSDARNPKAVQCDGFIFIMWEIEQFFSICYFERFDPRTGKWTNIDTMTKTCRDFAIAEMNSCIYVAGGVDDRSRPLLNNTVVYSVIENRWKKCANMNNGRANFGLIAVRGFLYAVGGLSTHISADSIEKYDPTIDVWSILFAKVTDFDKYSFSVINFNETILIAGGLYRLNKMNIRQVEIFNPQTKKFKQTISMNQYRHNFNLIRIPWNLANNLISRKKL